MPAEGLAIPIAQGLPAFVVGQAAQFLFRVFGQRFGGRLLVGQGQAQVDGEVAALQPAHVGSYIGFAVGEADRAALEVSKHPLRHAGGGFPGVFGDEFGEGHAHASSAIDLRP
ncbi:hypothetical protein D3C78_1457220 [compost metagenome]